MSLVTIRQQGFTLLEAIVAIAVLAMSAMALYAWLNSSLVILKRVDDVYQSVEAVESALEWVKVLDPIKQPQGEQEMAGATLAWRVEAKGAALAAKDMYSNPTVNDAQLFTVYIQIKRDDQVLANFEMAKLGFISKRSVEDLVF